MTAGTTYPKDITRDNGFTASQMPPKMHVGRLQTANGPKDLASLEGRLQALEDAVEGILTNQEVLLLAVNSLRTAVDTHNLRGILHA